MNAKSTVNRRQFLGLMSALATPMAQVALVGTLSVVAGAILLLDKLLGQTLQRTFQWSIQRLAAHVDPPLRALGIMGTTWAASYDSSQAFARIGASKQIRVDQVGYRTGDAKIAKLTTASDQFQVVDRTTGQTVFRGHPTLRTRHDDASGDTIYDLDFSSVTAPGSYEINVPGIGRSFGFAINDQVYDQALDTVRRGFYLQRCGAAVADDQWGHAACHLADADTWGPDRRRVELTGGWHDAGDFGKYVPSAVRTVSVLLSAFEFYPDRFAGGGATGQGIPEILTEARWELEWLRRMQTSSGGVYHKVTSRSFNGFFAPDQDHDGRFVFGVSSAATAGFAAVMAAAARVYQPFDATFAAATLKAAERAWSYLDQHPSIVPAGGFHNPPGISTGEYADSDDGDERFWAAAELFRTTGKPVYDAPIHAAFRRWRPYFIPPPHVAEAEGLGALAYILAPPAGGDPEIRQIMRDDLVQLGREIAAKVDGQGYQVALSPSEYYWGSNGVALSYAINLLYAEHVSKSPEFAAAALDQLHYVFGRNTLGKSFVTGVGANPVMRPHSQGVIALRDQTPPPGLLSGGPNAVESRDLAAYPARDYVDDSANYTVNETGIDMNAALIFVLARFASPATSSTAS